MRDGFLCGIKLPGTGKNAPIRITKASFDEFIRSYELKELESNKDEIDVSWTTISTSKIIIDFLVFVIFLSFY